VSLIVITDPDKKNVCAKMAPKSFSSEQKEEKSAQMHQQDRCKNMTLLKK
jgi:hypothetical protein